MRPQLRCFRCQHLEQVHDEITEQYLSLIDKQSRLFRDHNSCIARGLDAAIQQLRRSREAAINELFRHQADHFARARAAAAGMRATNDVEEHSG